MTLRLAAVGSAAVMLGLVLIGALAAEPATEIRVVLSDSGGCAQVAGELAWYGDRGQLSTSTGTVNVQLTQGLPSIAARGCTYSSSRLGAEPTAGYIQYGGQPYRGRLEFFLGKSGGLVVLNVLPLEDYLLGVVPAEMPAGWDLEALKAQAVAARTYAVARMAVKQDDTFDVYNEQSDQVYRGIAGEAERSSQAVRATTGQILLYQGDPIVAYYSSDAGGYTKAGRYEYLQPVPCPSPESPYNEWHLSLNPGQLASLAANAGQLLGEVAAVRAINDPVSGHLRELVLVGNTGECAISGNELRSTLGLSVMRSTRVRLANAEAAATEPWPSSEHWEASKTTPTTLSTVTRQEWHRLWVAHWSGTHTVKLRKAYVTDGLAISPCLSEVHVVSEGLAPPPAAGSFAEQAAPAEETQVTVGAEGITLVGSGYGHGVGMSQWGAKHLAEQGLSYVQILTHFYTGVELVWWDGSLATYTLEPADVHDFYQPFIPRY